MDTGSQRLCAWTGPVFIVLFAIGWVVLVRWLPPPAPSDTADQLVAMYRDHTTRIRLGLILVGSASALLLAFFAAISEQIKRMENGSSVLAYAQLACGVLAVVEFLIPIALWETATYRLDRSPEDTQLLHDLGFIFFFGPAGTVILQGVIIGIAILRDRRTDPIFPRWAGYFSIWDIMLITPACFVVMFKTGPIAWNGIMVWWLGLIAYFAWMAVNTVLLLRAANRQSTHEAAEPTPPDTTSMAIELAALRAQVDRLTVQVPRS